MNAKRFIQGRKTKVLLTLFLILLLAYLAIKFIFPGTDPLFSVLSFITHPVLLLIDKFSNIIFHWTGYALTIQNHSILMNGIPVGGFSTQIMYKKVTVFCILILWLTRASIQKRVAFTTIYLVLGFLSASAYNIALAIEITDVSQSSPIMSVVFTLVFICMNTTVLIWYLINRKAWIENRSGSSRIGTLLEKKLPDIIKVVYVYAIILFSLGFFDFDLLISFILGSSQKIAGLLGHDAYIEMNNLIGNNGSVSLARSCLGILTMFLFAAVVYLSGNEKRRGWGFIFIGLIVLIFANIVRIVLVFLHLQKYGDYMLTMDVHDLYNYATYVLVFILWVIWFEFCNRRIAAG